MIRVLSTALGLALLVALPAEAAFMPGFSGNMYVSSPNPSGDAHISFAVYDNTDGGSWASELGITPSDATGLTDKYVYFYQIVNSNLSGGFDGFVGSLSVDMGSFGRPKSAGFLFSTVFTDGGTAVGPSGNRGLGTDATESDPIVTGVTPTFTSTFSSTPLFTQVIPANSVNYYFLPLASGPVEQFTGVVFFTSDLGPGLGVSGGGGVSVGSPSAGGSAPVPVPVPSALALVALGFPFAAGVVRRRRAR